MQNDAITVNTDGGSRGNPGPAACAFVIRKGTKIIFKGSKYLNKSTNNDAEYMGVVLALNSVKENIDCFTGFVINFLLDSELVVKQLNGHYKIKNENLRNSYSIIQNTVKENGLKVTYSHIPREKNKDADKLVNEELDKNI